MAIGYACHYITAAVRLYEELKLVLRGTDASQDSAIGFHNDPFGCVGIMWAVAERKFSNMKGTYRNTVDNSRKMGTGRLGKKKWPYIDYFDNMYGNKPETDPVAVKVGVDVCEEPIANAASGVTQEGHGKDISIDEAELRKRRVPKSQKKT